MSICGLASDQRGLVDYVATGQDDDRQVPGVDPNDIYNCHITTT